MKCPECGSEKLIKSGHDIVKRKEVQRYLCKDCKRVTHKPTGKEEDKK